MLSAKVPSSTIQASVICTDLILSVATLNTQIGKFHPVNWNASRTDRNGLHIIRSDCGITSLRKASGSSCTNMYNILLTGMDNCLIFGRLFREPAMMHRIYINL